MRLSASVVAYRHLAPARLATSCYYYSSSVLSHPPVCRMATTAASRAKESVWDYPRPPAIEPTNRHLKVALDGVTIAETTRAHRILETSHPPTYYIPLEDVNQSYLRKNSRSTFCEWKGVASYYDIALGAQVASSRAWYYANPNPQYSAIKDAVAFYASPFNCYVDGELVVAQPGDFYGGWMTSDIDGGARGVKGGPGTWGW